MNRRPQWRILEGILVPLDQAFAHAHAMPVYLHP